MRFNPSRHRVKRLIDRVFYKKTFDYYDTISKVSHGLASTFDCEKIYSVVCTTLFSTLDLRGCYLFAASRDGSFKIVYHKPSKLKKTEGQYSSKDELPVLEAGSAIVHYFQDDNDILIRDDLALIKEKCGHRTIENIRDEFDRFGGKVAVPVYDNHELVLLIIAGGKKSGNALSDEDFKLLITVSHQSAVAIKNAKLYKEKLEAERLASIGMMSATFAHEIRNPLTSLKTFAQLMPEKYNDVEFRNTFSKIVVDDIDRINGLIKDLLDYSTNKSQCVDRVNIYSLVDETIEYVRGKLDMDRRTIQVEKEYEKDAEINTYGDIKKLRQAIFNIVNNGCQAMNGHGVLTVKIRPNGHDVSIDISDTGEGIPPAHMDDIFSPFVTSKEMGIGLGLAISKKIIDDHGGAIKVQSRLSEGTTFTVSLPLNDMGVVQ
ncbi:MAG: hypothetical protein AMK70_14240 [Nitrospira bacterium SG8_35_1]|nr:MAG: hypothetical protein AMK70_14240 [Nitrospira bacterium SG8_35_1]